jgi:hypothetical protein
MRDTVAGPVLENLAKQGCPRVSLRMRGVKSISVIYSLLAPKNLPFVAAHVPCELVLFTEERFFPSSARTCGRPDPRNLPCRLMSLDDLISFPDNYGIALTFVLHRGLADLGFVKSTILLP